MGSGFVRDVVALLEPFFQRHEEEVPEATHHLQVLAEAAQAADANAPIESEFWHSVEVALCIALREGNPRLMYALCVKRITSVCPCELHELGVERHHDSCLIVILFFQRLDTFVHGAIRMASRLATLIFR